MSNAAPRRRTISDQCSAADMYPYRAGQSDREIERAVTHLYPSQPFATHGSVCADLLFNKLVLNERARVAPSMWRDTIIPEVMHEQYGLVGAVLVYSANDPIMKRRTPKPLLEQRAAFKRNLFASWRLALQALERLQSADPTTASELGGQTVGEPQGHSGTMSAAEVMAAIAADPTGQTQAVEALSEPEPEPEPKPSPLNVGSTDPLRAHHEWSVAVRKVMSKHGHSWSMRPTIDGIALIAAGCPPKAVRDACTMDYPDDLREQLGVNEPFDFASFGTLEYLTKASSARVQDRSRRRPVCLALVGPAGTGKTTLAEILADSLGVKAYDISMSAGTPLSAFYGLDRLSADVIMSDFERWAKNGGIHLFDEIDCSDPNLLKIVNKALANRSYTNPLTSERVLLHEDAVAVAGQNTLGTGIQAEYSAAEQLDFSTIDRFRAGRIRVEIDEPLEARIVDDIIAAVQA